MRNDWESAISQLAELIRRESRFLVTGHESPDGDSLGSALALHLVLQQLGKESHCLFDRRTVPHKYLFMPGLDQAEAKAPSNDAVFVALECPNIERLGPYKAAAESAKSVINIDHHPDNGQWGTVNLVFPEAAATTVIIYELARELGADMTREVATCLYVGLVTDTGRFQYSNTDSASLDLAAELVRKGVEPSAVFQQVYENVGFPVLRLLARIIGKAVYLKDEGLVWSMITEQDLRDTGGELRDTENFIDYLRSVEGTKVALLIKEHSNGALKASLRSRGEIDVARIAHLQGGGGHRNAAGFNAKLTAEELVEFVLKHMADQ